MPAFNPGAPDDVPEPDAKHDSAFEKYVGDLPQLYKDILHSFPEVDPGRRAGFGLAIQTIHAALDGRYSLGTLRRAIAEMERHGVVILRNGIFAHPTELGEEIIAQLTGLSPAEDSVPPFPLPPTPGAR